MVCWARFFGVIISGVVIQGFQNEFRVILIERDSFGALLPIVQRCIWTRL
jgi:hypothetical protein